MCSECLTSPCASGCPNAPEPEPVYWCDLCGEGIMHDDTYFESGGEKACESCVDSMTVPELLEYFNIEQKIAEAPAEYSYDDYLADKGDHEYHSRKNGDYDDD